MNNFEIISLSDIHLGHKRTSSQHIIDNLDICISNEKIISKLDLLIIAGDIFDSQLTLSHPDIGIIDSWISRLLKLCNKHDVLIRILEGTPSHDRMQSERFVIINDIHKSNGFGCDLTYAKTLCIEHIDKFNLDILYVPDEWNGDNETTLNEVKDLLISKGISKVDYAIMHGTFDYQLGDIKNIPRHNTKEYCSIVKELIFVGHIHQYSKNNKVIAHGSFDRLAHGEEEKKGYISVSKNNDINKITFIENRLAKKYITIDSYNEELEVVFTRIDHAVKLLPNDSYVRIRCKKNDSINNNLPILKSRYMFLNISITTINEDIETNILIEPFISYQPIIINENNIQTLLIDEINKTNVNSDTLELCKVILKEVI